MQDMNTYNPTPVQSRRLRTVAWTLALACGVMVTSVGHAATATEIQQGYASAAGQAAQLARGQQFFTSTHGKEWSCSSCHTTQPTGPGKHASTGKVIEPMAPAVHAQRFTDPAKVEKWFRRNCNDVVGRECTAGEKSDVLAWLISLKP